MTLFLPEMAKQKKKVYITYNEFEYMTLLYKVTYIPKICFLLFNVITKTL